MICMRNKLWGPLKSVLIITRTSDFQWTRISGSFAFMCRVLSLVYFVWEASNSSLIWTSKISADYNETCQCSNTSVYVTSVWNSRGWDHSSLEILKKLRKIGKSKCIHIGTYNHVPHFNLQFSGLRNTCSCQWLDCTDAYDSYLSVCMGVFNGE